MGAADSDQVIGKSDFDFFEEELAQAAFDDEQQIMTTGRAITGKVEKKVLLDGRTGWALVSKIPFLDASGQLIGTCGISKNITELKNAERVLHEALTELEETHEALKAAQQRLIDFEKIQSIVRLTVGVAHEIRNPLNILSMGLGYLVNEPEISQDTARAKILDEMNEAIHRADAVITTLMKGAASANIKVNNSEVATILESAVTLMKTERPEQT